MFDDQCHHHKTGLVCLMLSSSQNRSCVFDANKCWTLPCFNAHCVFNTEAQSVSTGSVPLMTAAKAGA